MVKKINTINKSFYDTLLVTIVIIVSDDTLLFGTNSNISFVTFKYVVLVGMLIFLGVKRLAKAGFGQMGYLNISCVLMCCLVLLSGIVNGDLRTGYFYKCVILLLSCIVVETISLKSFALCFEKVMFILAFISMVCTILAEINLNFFSIFPVFYNTADTPFYNLGIYMVPTSTQLLRNYGIFREPGVYQMYLVIALLFHLYFSDILKIKHIITFIVSIVLTFSTTGYIALSFLLILFLLKKSENHSDVKKKRVLIFFVILGILYMVTSTDLLSSDGMVFDKFSNPRRTTMIARSSSIVANLIIWRKSPILGAGLVSISEQFPILTYQIYGKAISHNTNTLMCELATYGIIYTFVLIYGYVEFSKAMSCKISERLLLLTIIFILFCGEKLTFSLIVYVLLFYGIAIKDKGIRSCDIKKYRLQRRKS